MKVKVNEAEREVLDWMVAKCEGRGIEFDDPSDPWLTRDGIADQPLHSYNPSTDWSQGGPIIEREKIGCSCQTRAGRRVKHGSFLKATHTHTIVNTAPHP